MPTPFSNTYNSVGFSGYSGYSGAAGGGGTSGYSGIGTSGYSGISGYSGAGFAGTGTSGYIPKFTGASSLGNSLIQDNGTTVTVNGALSCTTGANFATSSGSVGIGTASPAAPLHIAFGSAVNDAELRIQQTTNGTASQITIAANNDGGAIYNFIRSVTTSGTEHWRIGGGATASTMAFSTNSIERARITSAGDVGIGTTSPAYKLQVQGAAGSILSWTDGTTPGTLYSGGGYVGLTYPAGEGGFFINVAGEFNTISTNGSERLRVDSSGNVGIGTASPAFPLDVNLGLVVRGNATRSGSGMFLANDSTYGLSINAVNHLVAGLPLAIMGYPIKFLSSETGGELARIDTSGNLLVGTTSSTTGNVNGSIFFGGADAGIIYLERQTGTDQMRFYVGGNRIGQLNTGSSVLTLGTANYPLAFSTNDAERMRITAAGNVGIGTTSPAYKLDVSGTVADSIGDLRTLPQNSQSAAYTTVLSDSGKHILHPSADTTARTFTIDSNTNVAYAIGTALTFVNQNGAGVVTIAITNDTMRLAGAGTTGSRTLAANGVATAIKITSTEWIISGNGLT